MLGSRKIYILVAIVFALGAGFVGKSLYNIFYKKINLTTETPAQLELKKERSNDLAILNNVSAPNEKVASSLLRYTSQNLPESEDLIKKFSENSDPKVKAAALEASGAYEWASTESFSEALKSDNQELRRAALRGLGKRSDEARIQLINEYLGRNKLSGEDLVEAKITEHRLVREQSAKDKIVKELLVGLLTFSPELQSKTLVELFLVAPDQAELKHVAQLLLKSDDSAAPAASALQYEAGFDREWLTQELDKIIIRNDYNFQTAMLDFLLAACPPAWKAIEAKLAASPANEIISGRLSTGELSKKCQ